jgi:branched-subunit amino acid aminotransferase/4-amino-4-deoxychorismate lyase
MPDIVIIYPDQTASLAPTSSAFAHGFGLFETIRYAAGKLYFWQEHWERLKRSAHCFALPLPESAAVLAALRELVTQSGIEAGTIKLSLVKTKGTGACMYVYSRLPFAMPAGNHLLLDRNYPIYARSLIAGHKTHNYMEGMYLLSLARSHAYYDMLRIDSEGRLAETTTANLFFVKDGRVHSPALDTGILPGVIRGALLDASDLDIDVGHFAPDVLLDAESVFVTNATNGLQVIERIDGFADGESVTYASSSETLSVVNSVLVRLQAKRAYQLI